MKLATTLMLALVALVALVAATPNSEQARRTVNCDDCKKRFDFCFSNGRTQGQEGCAKTCAQHVVYQTPECRSCGGELSDTPEESRYHKACGENPC